MSRAEIALLRADQAPPNSQVGDLLVAVTVLAANVVKDIHQNIRNLIGGPMSHYEKLVEQSDRIRVGQVARQGARAWLRWGGRCRDRPPDRGGWRR